MSDKEQGAISRSASRSLSRERSPASAKSVPGLSPARARSRSAHSRSRSRSRSYTRSRRRSRSRSYGRRNYHSRSRSRSPYSRRRRSSRYSRSRSRSRSRHGAGYSDRRRGYYRSHSRSPMSGRRRHEGSRENPKTSKCIGVFGLSLYTQERDIRDVFDRYGPIEEVQVVFDHQTGRSRGFAFVYYRNLEDAEEAKEHAPSTEIDGRSIRVDYSITQRAHTPTPGIYLGQPSAHGEKRSSYSRRSASPDRYQSDRYQRGGGRRGSRYYSRSRSRSYSPRRY